MNDRSAFAIGVKVAIAVAALFLAFLLFRQVQAVIVLLLIAVVLATGIDPAVERIHGWRGLPGKRQISRSLAAIIVLVGALLVFVGIVFYIGSVLWTEGTRFWQQLPEYVEAAEARLAAMRQQYPQIPPVEEMGPRLQEQLGRAGGYAAQTVVAVFGVLGGLLSTLTVLILTFYITISKGMLREAFLSVTPPDRHEYLLETMSDAGSKMGGWLRGQLILGGIVIVVVSLLMWLLGMPYPFLLGLIGGIAELVPLLGPFVAGLVAVPIALLTQPTWVAIVVIVFFLAFSQVEGNWLAPRIMQSQVGLSPLSTILALLAGTALLGVIGALLAVPLAAGIRVLLLRLAIPAIQDYYRTRSGPPDPDAIPADPSEPSLAAEQPVRVIDEE